MYGYRLDKPYHDALLTASKAISILVDSPCSMIELNLKEVQPLNLLPRNQEFFIKKLTMINEMKQSEPQ